MTDPTPDRLDDLRTEYANTGMVTSDGAVWLFSQVVVLREKAARAAGPAPATDQAALVEDLVRVLHELHLRRDFEPDEFVAEVLAVLPAPAGRAAVLREAADGYTRQGKTVLAASQVAADLRRRADVEPRRMADETPQPTTKPAVAYSGKGRLWCRTCPRPNGENVPMTVDLVCVGELCAGCGRDVIDLARAAVPAVGAQPDEEPRTVAYRSPQSLYCLRHTGEIFGTGFHPVTSEDLPDGGICTYPECGTDVLIPQPDEEV